MQIEAILQKKLVMQYWHASSSAPLLITIKISHLIDFFLIQQILLELTFKHLMLKFPIPVA